MPASPLTGVPPDSPPDPSVGVLLNQSDMIVTPFAEIRIAGRFETSIPVLWEYCTPQLCSFLEEKPWIL